MHVSSHDNMRRCVKRHVLTDQRLAHKAPLRVLDVDGVSADGDFRSLFTFTETDYVVADDNAVALPGDDGSFDVVFSARAFGASGNFWRLFAEMTRLVSNDGVIVIVAPSDGARAAAGGYRFGSEAFAALAADAGVLLVESFQDPRGPHRNQVGVFRRSTPPPAETSLDHTHYMPLLDGALQNDAPEDEVSDHELISGTMPKLPFLKRLHRTLQPRFYFEVGVCDGASLRLTKCPAIGVDPDPQIKRPLKPHQSVHTGISADFFGEKALVDSLGPVDLAYIDGMHLIENAFEDYVNTERSAHPLSVILVDDIYPNHPQQGLRSRASRHWTGDVWKMIPILRERRPDLMLLPVDTYPTGTLIVLGADPDDATLWDDWDLIVTEAIEGTEIPPDEILERTHALDPEDPLIWQIMTTIQKARDTEDPDGPDRVRRLVEGAFPRKVTREVTAS